MIYYQVDNFDFQLPHFENAWAKTIEYMFRLLPSARQESVWMDVFATAVSYFNRFISEYREDPGKALPKERRAFGNLDGILGPDWYGILGVVCMGLAVKMKGCPLIDQGLLEGLTAEKE